MSVCNNDVTYHDKWDTHENRQALAILEKKFFNKSECRPDCPVAWAPEVLELMETLERELGFVYNEKTMRGYYIQGTPKDWFLTNPWSGFFYAFKKNVFTKPKDTNAKRLSKTWERPYMTLSQRLIAIPMGFFDPIGYGIRALTMRYINPLRNKFFKKRIYLGQLKEKYGYLTCYFHAPEAFKEFIEKEKAKCIIKLALKGAYYPIETLYNSSIEFHCGTVYHPDTYEITHGDNGGKPFTNVKITTMRMHMADMGLDMEDIKNKADMRAASKADPI